MVYKRKNKSKNKRKSKNMKINKKPKFKKKYTIVNKKSTKIFEECCVCYENTEKNKNMCHTTCKKCLHTMLELYELSCPLCRKNYTNKTISLNQKEINKVLEKHAIELKQSIVIENIIKKFGEYILYMKGIIKENDIVKDCDIYEIKNNEYYVCYNYKFITHDGKKGIAVKDIKKDVTSYRYALKVNINNDIKKIYKKLNTIYKPKYKYDFSMKYKVLA